MKKNCLWTNSLYEDSQELKKGMVLQSLFPITCWKNDSPFHNNDFVGMMPMEEKEFSSKIKTHLIDVEERDSSYEFVILFELLEDMHSDDLIEPLFSSCNALLEDFDLHPRSYFLESIHKGTMFDEQYMMFLGT